MDYIFIGVNYEKSNNNIEHIYELAAISTSEDFNEISRFIGKIQTPGHMGNSETLAQVHSRFVDWLPETFTFVFWGSKIPTMFKRNLINQKVVYNDYLYERFIDLRFYIADSEDLVDVKTVAVKRIFAQNRLELSKVEENPVYGVCENAIALAKYYTNKTHICISKYAFNKSEYLLFTLGEHLPDWTAQAIYCPYCGDECKKKILNSTKLVQVSTCTCRKCQRTYDVTANRRLSRFQNIIASQSLKETT